jgi:hypothetical protein
MVAIPADASEGRWMISWFLNISCYSLLSIEDAESLSTGTDLQCPKVNICIDCASRYLLFYSDIIALVTEPCNCATHIIFVTDLTNDGVRRKT